MHVAYNIVAYAYGMYHNIMRMVKIHICFQQLLVFLNAIHKANKTQIDVIYLDFAKVLTGSPTTNYCQNFGQLELLKIYGYGSSSILLDDISVFA